MTSLSDGLSAAMMTHDPGECQEASTRARKDHGMTDLEFIQVGELAKGMVGEPPPAVTHLAGRSLRLAFADGTAARLTFSAGHTLEWEWLEGPQAGGRETDTYWACRPRDGIYFVDFVKASQRATSVSIVLDLGAAAATIVVGTLPAASEVRKSLFDLANEGADLTAVGARFLAAAIDRPFDAASHHQRPTAEMVGKRVKYVYSPTETYEHSYLNDKLYTWQCLAGIEKGLADTDRCHAIKLGEQLYFFVWREKVVPTLGVVVADWRNMKSVGKLFGYETSDFGALVNAPIAASATLVNVADHAELKG